MQRAISIFVCSGLLFGSFFGSAVHSVQAQQVQCVTPEQRAACLVEEAELLKEIAVGKQIVKDLQAQESTYKGDITLFKARIKAAQAQIDAKNISIKLLGTQIAQKNVVIGQLTDRIARGKEALASIMRQTQMLDDYSAVDIALGAQSVSDFFIDLDAFVSIKVGMAALFADIRVAQAQTEKEKVALALKQNQTVDAKYVVVTQQQKITSDKIETQQLLAIKETETTKYKKVLAERQAKAAAIRAALFPLRDAGAISFGDALKYAQQAQKSTGVDPALILAILTQESNLGANVGRCYLTNNATGAGVGKDSDKVFAKVMSPTRDVPPFRDLGLRLGFDPHKQVVSCPIAGVVGWGGAMGPAQFIPSTWKMYEARIASVSGHAVPNPWDPQDAIMAMSIYLGDLGADADGYTAEHRAAAKYYAGGAWETAGQRYANSVMAKISGPNGIQAQIDFLSNN